MKISKIKNRRLGYLILAAALIAISWDIAVSSLAVEKGTFRYESEFDALSGATTKVGLVTSYYEGLSNPVGRSTNPSYDQIEEMVAQAIELQGGFDWVIDKGDKVMIKVNLVGGSSHSGDGENTDVRVVKALIKCIANFTGNDVEIVVAEGTARSNDDPTDPNSVWGNGGYIDLLSDPLMAGINLRLLNLNQGVDDLIEIDLGSEGTSALQGTKYHVHKEEVEADVYIAVPVLKIHNTGITNALKLQIGSAPGCYYGYNKSRGTALCPEGIYHDVGQRVWTTEAIVDLCNIADIDFVVVDAIMCLESHKNYDPNNQVRYNTILAGADPVAIDHASAKLMGINPDDVAHITLAEKVGLGTNNSENIKIEGVPMEDAMIKAKKSQHVDGKFGQSNRTWMLSQTFEGDDIDRKYFKDENNIQPLPGEDGWSKPVYFFDDRIDLFSYYEGKTNVVTYAFTYFDAPDDMDAQLWIGTHEAMVVTINGEEAYKFSSTASYSDDDRDKFKRNIKIKKGKNTLLVKTLNKFGDFTFALNICEIESNALYAGNRVSGLKFYIDDSGSNTQISTASNYFEQWELDNLENIGGHGVEVLGDPQVVETEIGDAIQFDGNGDQLLIDFNPIKEAKEFTVELIFKPDACYPNNEAPRFVHIQDPDDQDGKRVMIELRVNENNECYMDGFIKTDSDNLALIDETLVHATEVWHHVAITYKDSVFTTFFNGEKELSGVLKYSESIVNTLGKTSLGARMNEVSHFCGLMKTFKVSHAALDPQDFLKIPEAIDTSATSVSFLDSDVEVKLYPNPADKVLNLELSKLKNHSRVTIEIIDMAGKVAFLKASEYNNEEKIMINTSNFKEGFYVVQIKSDHLIAKKKFLVVH